MIKATLTIYYNKGENDIGYVKENISLLSVLRTVFKMYYYKDFPAKLVIEKRQDE